MENLMPYLKKILAVLLAVLTPALTLLIAVEPTASLDLRDEIVEYKIGGFMKGVCHADPDYELIKEANIGWTRKDIPFPYNKDGSLSQHYLNWKAEMKAYADNGIRIFAITPYPDDYIEYGLDPRDPASKEGIQEIARFYIEDLKGIAGAIQVTNEMGIDRFTYPLTLEEAADFIGMQLEAMYPVRGNTIIGYNLGGLAILELPFLMAKYHRYCDYVGLDMYLGSFEDISHWLDHYLVILGFVRKVTNKPIIMCEFGYIGYGKPKTEEEKKAVLQQYGFDSEEEATAAMDRFIENLPEDMKEEILELYPDYTFEQYADILFNGEYKSHLYTSLPDGLGLYGYDHTPEGQAKFYQNLIPRIMAMDYVVGAVIYCWGDSEACYVCGQAECPVETGWGLVDNNGNPKPAYYAVQKAFSERNAFEVLKDRFEATFNK